MKTAIVTGASSGIGLEICKKLNFKNIAVFGFGRDFSKTNYTHALFHPITCDLRKTGPLAEEIKKIRKEHEISILINNAGVGYYGPHEEQNPAKIHEMVTVNLEVPILLSQLLLRDIKKNSGYIINISSVTATKSSPHGCAYAATKAGLASFSNSLFDETRKYGVKVVNIMPDMTKTSLYRNANFDVADTADTYLDPVEVADCVMYILSQREGLVITDITLKPQRHQLSKK
ncbi:SDR family oxidoreductase [Clostridium sp. Marseille-P299]|uniref:SDR family oxidoreductase n=1 Tax=Clostridium sp. Marseille-P299 TaxID=1805477 RepID=UPI00083692EA|nr:SDR family NAD(P)-dependent oxidoreductase [Clostridium sp. Marseille-P299]